MTAGTAETRNYDALYEHFHEDTRIISGADFEHMDTALLQKYIQVLKTMRPGLRDLADDRILDITGLRRDGAATLVAVLSFSVYPQAFLPQLYINASVVPGTGTWAECCSRGQYSRRIDGTISEMLSGAVSFVKRYMWEGISFTPDGRKADVPEYPLKAVREAVLNALLHRDYSPCREGTPVCLDLYDDRLEITSPGGLACPLSYDSERITARTRNATLVLVQELMGVAENRSSGIPFICTLVKSAGLPEPVFRDDGSMFTVILYNSTHKG